MMIQSAVEIMMARCTINHHSIPPPTPPPTNCPCSSLVIQTPYLWRSPWHSWPNKAPSAPGIIKLLDWQDQRDNCHGPRVSVGLQELSLLEGHGGRFDEGLVRPIMRQATQVARTCCLRGIFHGDIKLENFSVSKDTQQVRCQIDWLWVWRSHEKVCLRNIVWYVLFLKADRENALVMQTCIQD